MSNQIRSKIIPIKIGDLFKLTTKINYNYTSHTCVVKECQTMNEYVVITYYVFETNEYFNMLLNNQDIEFLLNKNRLNRIIGRQVESLEIIK